MHIVEHQQNIQHFEEQNVNHFSAETFGYLSSIHTPFVSYGSVQVVYNLSLLTYLLYS